MRITSSSTTSGERVLLFIGAELAVFAILRITLFLHPFINLNLGVYPIHHLFIGAFALVVAVTFFLLGFANRTLILLAGMASGLILDEIVYLIVTDGSDIAYLTPVSFVGALILIMITLLITGIGYHHAMRKKVG